MEHGPRGGAAEGAARVLGRPCGLPAQFGATPAGAGLSKTVYGLDLLLSQANEDSKT